MTQRKKFHLNPGCLYGDTGLFHRTSMYVAQCAPSPPPARLRQAGGGVRLPPAPPPCIRPCPMYPSLVCQLTYCITQLLLVMLVRIHIKY